MESMRLIQTADMRCDDAAIASAAAWWGVNYEMAYSRFWDFNFLSEKEAGSNLIGNRIKTPDENNKFIDLKKYHGICATPYYLNTPEELVKTVLREAKSHHPTVMDINPANKPWATKHDFDDKLSFIMIYEFDKSKNGFYCLDIHGSKKVEFLPMQSLLDESEKRESFDIGCLSRTDEKEYQIDWKKFLLDSVNNICNNPKRDYFGALKMFADSFKDIDLKAEYEGPDFYFSMLCTKMKNICRFRNLYALSLSYLAKKFNVSEINDIAKMFNVAGSKWYLSLALLTKSFYRGKMDDTTKEKIKTNIYNVAAFEKEICDSIYRLCSAKTIKTSGIAYEDIPDKNRGEKCIHLKLDDYFNNKAFYTDEHIDNYDGTNSCFLKDGLPDNGILSYNEKTFDITNCLLPKQDNISCASQTINIDVNEKVRKISFLCSGEWGNFYETATLVFDDGKTQKLYLTFPDWIYKSTYEKLSIAWQGLGMFENREKTGEVFIFEQEFPVGGKRIKSIKLPNSPNCHIFAATLVC
jgi:predicted DNA-binding protein YlxM (UPF0122 family)